MTDEDVYSLYQEGLARIDAKDPAAAVEVLRKAAAAEPAAENVREALARAQFDAKLFSAARASFASITETNPANDYAWFGLGLAEQRLQNFAVAAEHLTIASVMRPEREDYRKALDDVRATLRFRADPLAGGPSSASDASRGDR